MYLYRYEAKGIQPYVLGTERLVEMAGASSLIEDLGDMLGARLSSGAEVLTSAAGAATVRFANRGMLEAFASVWPRVVDQHAPGLTIVQGWTQITGGDERAARERVRVRLEAARNEQPADLPEVGPLVMRAGRTGLPAIARDTRGEAWVDRATRAKEQRGMRERDGRNDDALVERLRVASGVNFRATTDMNAFEGGYAVVHADADGVGQFLVRRALSPAEFQEFSRGLAAVTLEAAADAVRALDHAQGEERAEIGIRPVVLGGDDFTVVITARHGIAFAARFIKAFSEKGAEKLARFGWTPTASAGIAIVKRGHPFHAAYALSEDLCRAAKSGGGGALLFHRVTTSAGTRWAEIVEDELSSETVSLADGPWTMAAGPRSLTALASLVVAVRRLPRGALREWVREVLIHEGRAQARWKRMLEVQGPEASPLVQALKRLETDPESGLVGDEGDRTSPIFAALTWSGVAANNLLWVS